MCIYIYIYIYSHVIVYIYIYIYIYIYLFHQLSLKHQEICILFRNKIHISWCLSESC